MNLSYPLRMSLLSERKMQNLKVAQEKCHQCLFLRGKCLISVKDKGTNHTPVASSESSSYDNESPAKTVKSKVVRKQVTPGRKTREHNKNDEEPANDFSLHLDSSDEELEQENTFTMHSTSQRYNTSSINRNKTLDETGTPTSNNRNGTLDATGTPTFQDPDSIFDSLEHQKISLNKAKALLNSNQIGLKSIHEEQQDSPFHIQILQLNLFDKLSGSPYCWRADASDGATLSKNVIFDSKTNNRVIEEVNIP